MNVSNQTEPGKGSHEPGKDSSTWIAEVSHELRLPIANLRLLIETLLDGAIDDPDAGRRMLNRAQQEVERLQNLVVNLLSVEQVASVRSEIHGRWNLLSERAAYAVDTVKRQADEKELRISIDVPPNAMVYANAEQLDQVLLNLMENAVKFTPPGGEIAIKAGDQAGSFSVVDSGIGLAADEIPKIFQRFYRVDRAQSRGSTGLGLSIVKHIVDLHGAKITVDSKEGHGSSFMLEFPGPA
jgi:two-component system, OmpR family, phosphate regulon sensor histidine kinase PhoR